jgi:hypothetical protein
MSIPRGRPTTGQSGGFVWAIIPQLTEGNKGLPLCQRGQSLRFFADVDVDRVG